MPPRTEQELLCFGGGFRALPKSPHELIAMVTGIRSVWQADMRRSPLWPWYHSVYVCINLHILLSWSVGHRVTSAIAQCLVTESQGLLNTIFLHLNTEDIMAVRVFMTLMKRKSLWKRSG